MIAAPIVNLAKPRLRPLLFLGCLSLILAAGACTSDPRPSVLIVTIDTLRADHTSAYGYGLPTTPELERIAADGVLFEKAYSMTSTTGPSHAALLTGRYPRALGVLKNGHVVAEEERLLPEVFADAGYDTAGFVSSYPLREKFGFAQGFAHWDEHFTIEESSHGSANYKRGRNRIAEFTAGRFMQWSARRAEKPWFSWVHFVDPHSPYQAPEPFKARWPKGTKSWVKKYDGEVHYVDGWLGRLYDHARAHAGPGGLLFIVTADHGEGLGDHQWMGHGVNLYEEAVRIPMVAVWEGHLEAGLRVSEPVSLIDVAPTVLDEVGLGAPDGIHGGGLFGDHRVVDRMIVLQRRAYSSKKDQGVDVRGDLMGVVRWPEKLLMNEGADVEDEELYDLDHDPREQNDISVRRRPEVQALRGHLETWTRATPEPGREQAPLSEEDKRELRALGYVD